MSSEQETQDREESEEATESRADEETRDTGSDSGSGEEEELSASEKAKRETEEREEAEKEVQALEDDPPTDLSEWPDGKAKYLTFGGPEGDQGYEEGVTSKLGPSEVRHHEDGTVTVGGEEVDDPGDYKGEPIPGGPTDPNSPDLAGESNDKDDDEDDDARSSERPGPGSQNGQQAEDDDSEDDS